MLRVHLSKCGMVENAPIRLSVGLAMLGMKRETIVCHRLKYVVRMVSGMECNVYANQPTT